MSKQDPESGNHGIVSTMLAKDLMRSPAVTIRTDESISRACDLFQAAHVNGLPVIGADEVLVGIVTEEDVLYGGMTAGEGAPALDRKTVAEIMTSPAACVTEHEDVNEICRLMWRMRIHHVPIVREGVVIGVVSALDVVRAVVDGKLVIR